MSMCSYLARDMFPSTVTMSPEALGALSAIAEIIGRLLCHLDRLCLSICRIWVPLGDRYR